MGDERNEFLLSFSSHFYTSAAHYEIVFEREKVIKTWIFTCNLHLKNDDDGGRFQTKSAVGFFSRLLRELTNEFCSWIRRKKETGIINQGLNKFEIKMKGFWSHIEKKIKLVKGEKEVLRQKISFIIDLHVFQNIY